MYYHIEKSFECIQYLISINDRNNCFIVKWLNYNDYDALMIQFEITLNISYHAIRT